MNRPELLASFQGQISRKAIRQDFDGACDNEAAIVGRYCRIVPCSSGWDTWLCNTRDPTPGLTPRKVTALLVGIADRLDPDHAPHTPDAAATWGDWHILDGEAWGRRLATADILACLPILGIRRKAQVSDEQRAASSARLAAAREARA